MNKAELQDVICQTVLDKKGSLSKADVNIVVDTVFECLKGSLKNAKTISIRGFGNFELNRTNARKGRNPKTGEAIDVPAKNRVKFKPSLSFQEDMNS